MNKSVCLIVLLLILSCNQNPTQKSNYSEKEVENDSTLTISNNIFYLFPSPNEFIDIIDKTGVVFKEKLLHEASFAKNYNNPVSINLNLGIYIADMAYCGLFEQYSDMQIIKETISYLSRYVYISTSLKNELQDFANYNQYQLDSLEINYNNLYYKIVNDLESSQQQKTVALVSAGAYIESLYLSLNTLQGINRTREINLKLGSQQFAFKNLIAYIESIGSDKKLDEIEQSLKKIISVYQETKTVVESTASNYDSDSTLRITGGNRYYMNDKTFDKLLLLVNDIRNEMISQS